MGVVYRAWDAELHRDVAVKVLGVRFPVGSGAARRFLEEAQITAQLQHPAIPPIHHVGALPDGRPFLIMKLVKGRTLASLLADATADGGGLLSVFEQVCQAVAYAHSRGVVHRDLKPQNVMVGAFGEVQVMDWGLAKFRTEGRSETPEASVASTFYDPRADEDEPADTRAGAIIGIPAWMPPEQAIGAVDQIDARSDVFGLGAVLCAVLTGQPPYLGTDAESTRQLAARAMLADAGARLDGCGAAPELIGLCRRCLAADKAARPANAGEVAGALAVFRAAADERAREADLGRAKADVRAEEERKRRRALAALGGVLVAALAVGGGVAAVQWWRAERARARATADERRATDALATAKAQQGNTVAAVSLMTDDLLERFFANRQALGEEQIAFLREALDLLRQSSAGVETSPADRSTQAGILCSIGAVHRALGERDVGLAAYVAARDLRETALADAPADDVLRDLLAYTRCKVAEVQVDAGRPEAAAAEYAAARDLRLRVVATVPGEPRYREYLAYTRSSLGHVLEDLRRRDEAAAEYAAARDLYRGLLADVAGNLTYRDELAVCHFDLGKLDLDAGRPDGAAAEYATARDLEQLNTAASPDGLDYRDHLAFALLKLATIKAGAHAYPEALRLLEDAAPHHRIVLTAKPADPGFRKGFRNNQWLLATVLVSLGEPAGVRRCAAEMLKHSVDPRGDSYAAARLLAAAARVEARAHPATPESAAQYADQAMIYLREAVRLGFRDVKQLRNEADLGALRGRRDYQKLAAELETGNPEQPPSRAGAAGDAAGPRPGGRP
jgi:tetratricopeptide (TPR) repeat protein